MQQHLSPRQRADLVSHSCKCTGSFTSTCGAGYKRMDNPQIQIILQLSSQLADKSALPKLLATAKVTFELRRRLPISSRYYNDGLGFSLVRLGDKTTRRVNTRLSCVDDVVAESEFVTGDVVTMTIDASRLLLPQSGRLIAIVYGSTPFITADFDFSVVISQPRQLASVLRSLTSSAAAAAASSSPSPQPPPREHNNEEDDIKPPPHDDSSSRSPSRCSKPLENDNDDDDDIRPPPLDDREEDDALAVRCVSMSVLPECSVEFSHTLRMQGEGAAGYGLACGPQFFLSLTKPRSNSSNNSSVCESLTANIEMTVEPLSGRPQSFEPVGIRFFVAEDPEASGRNNASPPERLKGYFPTGEIELSDMERGSTTGANGSYYGRVNFELLDPRGRVVSSNNLAVGADKSKSKNSDSNGNACEPWKSELEPSDEHEAALAAGMSRSEEACLLLLPSSSESAKPTRVWRSIFMTTTRVAIEAVPLIHSENRNEQHLLFRILACASKPGFECSVTMKVKLFPSDASHSYDVQFSGAEHVAPRVQPRDFPECFARAHWSSHVVYERTVFDRFLAVDEARRIVDNINTACEKAVQLSEQQHSGVARQYNGSNSSSNSSKEPPQIVFQDPHFPPHSHVSINVVNSGKHGGKNQSTVFRIDASKLILDQRWRHPAEVANHPVLLSSSNNTLSLPMQSKLVGNCWCISALTAIAAATSRLDDILKRAIYPNKGAMMPVGGAFCVSFFIGGEWRAVIIDALLPTSKGVPAFARSTDRNELWASLYEKAIAKMFGGYSALNAGAPLDVAFHMMTGGAASAVFFRESGENNNSSAVAMITSPVRRSASALLERVKVYASNRWPMCVSSDRPDEGERVRENLIVSNHGYSILDVRDTANNHLLRLRNPWGFGRRKQLQSSSSETDTQHRLHDDGTFWISFDELLTEFDYIAFCRITSDVFSRRCRLLVPVLDDEESERHASSKWNADATRNAQVVIQIPAMNDDNNSSSSEGNFVKLRITLDPIGVRGGGFHFHVVPLEHLESNSRQPGPPLSTVLRNVHGVSTRDVVTSIAEEQLAQQQRLSTAESTTSNTATTNSTAIVPARFFLSHSDITERLQVAHAQGYFGAVFESDATSEATCVFESGKRYLLVPYRVGSGFDGAFSITVETGFADRTSPLVMAVLPPPTKIGAIDANFTLTCNFRSSLNPQFLLENLASEFAVTVRIECELLLCVQQESDADLEDGLEILLLKAPEANDVATAAAVRESLSSPPPIVIMGGRTAVEDAVVDQSPFYRAQRVSLVTALKPSSRYLVMPNRGRGTEAKVRVTVWARVSPSSSSSSAVLPVRFSRVG